MKKNKDQLEYNDGIGDMLRDKEPYQEKQSTLKLIVLLVLVFLIIIMFLFLSFKLIKKIIITNYELQKLELRYKEKSSPKINCNKSKMKSAAACDKKTNKKVNAACPAKLISKKEISAKASCAKNMQQTKKVTISCPSKNKISKNSDSKDISDQKIIAINKPLESTKPIMAKQHHNGKKSCGISKKTILKNEIKKCTKIKKSVVNAEKKANFQKEVKIVKNSNVIKYKYKIVTESFATYDQAKIKVTELKAKGIDSFVLKTLYQGKEVYFAQVGSLASYKKAKALVKEFKKSEINTTIINVTK
ncbi:MAG: SPOR domain-containing protein [Candidatus Margulisiibacteriota bacterium]|jgi:hypothetical protein